MHEQFRFAKHSCRQATAQIDYWADPGKRKGAFGKSREVFQYLKPVSKKTLRKDTLRLSDDNNLPPIFRNPVLVVQSSRRGAETQTRRATLCAQVETHQRSDLHR